MTMTIDNTQPYVSLWYSTGAGIIYGYNTGIVYMNRCGGLGGGEKGLEGFYTPIETENSKYPIKKALRLHFLRKYQDQYGCYGGIDEEDANTIDELLSKSPHTTIYQVDRKKLELCQYGWIYLKETYEVKVRNSRGQASLLVSNVYPSDCVLVWHGK